MASNFLEHRANINRAIYDNKDIYIYEDHRYILNVLKFLEVYRNFELPVDIVYFDYHDDSYQNEILIENIEKYKKYSFKDFYNHVEFEHSNQDDDWLISGIEYGFIKNVINVGIVEESLNIIKDKYVDNSGLSHSIEYIKIRDDKKLKPKSIEKLDRKFILDIDLDFFIQAVDLNNFSYGDLDNFFTKELFENETLRDVFNELIAKSSLITICLESNYCFGHVNSLIFLEYLNINFFEGKLSELY